MASAAMLAIAFVNAPPTVSLVIPT